MSIRPLERIVASVEARDGAGVTLRRAIGNHALANLDPFLMLDHFGSDRPGDYIAGFPDHPHRGFITLTYMLDGRMLHQDSMGNRGELKGGDVQWMKAASGIIHSEMPQQEHGLLRGFQLWLNLPAREKMSEPAYRDLSAQDIPVVRGEGCEIRLLAGEVQGTVGPLLDPHTALYYADCALGGGSVFEQTLDGRETAFVFVFEGEVSIEGQAVPAHCLGVLGPGEHVRLAGGPQGGRCILVAGRPLGEPIVQHGPFVMNSREEILQALDDYNRGRLVRQRAAAL